MSKESVRQNESQVARVKKLRVGIIIAVVGACRSQGVAQDTPPAPPPANAQVMERVNREITDRVSRKIGEQVLQQIASHRNFLAGAQTAAAPQYFTLSLPAGISLISSPLDTGQRLAINAFQGMPPDWPLFYGWDAANQKWVSGDQAPMIATGGYWVYFPIPTTLVVAGQPYVAPMALTAHIAPGWHLFGVPFEEGVAWKDFQLYTSGNPIGLDTALEWGWIGANVITTQGSEFHYHRPGDPFPPGEAFWIQTTVPLDVRAERQGGVTPATESGLLAVSTPLATGSSTTSTTMGWLSAISELLVDVCKGAVEAAEGDFGGATFEFLGGVFGLIEHGTAPDITNQLSDMDAKLDTLISDQYQIANQLTALEGQISNFQNYSNTSALDTAVTNSDAWLLNYYTDQTKVGQSRNWARWYLAGCPIHADSPQNPGCPQATTASNNVTSTSYQNFVANYLQNPVKNPSQTVVSPTDDFPLYWAYGVINAQQGFNINGRADTLITGLWQGLTVPDPVLGKLPLTSFMEFALANSSCASDVTFEGTPASANGETPAVPACDLFEQVYLPLEAYFLHAVGDQAQLAEAMAEAYEVLESKFDDANGNGPYKGYTQSYMSGVNQKVNQEAEVFLEVAEQLALYRAGDSRWDWNTFGSGNSDAALILARADFLVSQLGVQPVPTTDPSLTPPWPASGVVGRIFYVNQEPALAATATRGVCAATAGAFCSAPVAQLSEDGSNTSLTGGQPYLQWGTSSPLTGIPNTSWVMQRVTPMQLGVGAYLVNSTSAGRFGAPLTVAMYDQTYTPVTAASQTQIPFGSFNAIEGPIGNYGLPLTQMLWTATVNNNTGFIPQSGVFQNSVAYSDAANPGAVAVDMTFLTNAPSMGQAPYYPPGWSWSGSVNLTLDPSLYPTGFETVHLHWPAGVSVNVSGQATGIGHNGLSGMCGNIYYYDGISYTADLNDDVPQPFDPSTPNTTYARVSFQCSANPFNSCQISGDQSISQALIAPNPKTNKQNTYTLYVGVVTNVDPKDMCWFDIGGTYKTANPGSTASFLIQAPSFTLTKNPAPPATSSALPAELGAR